MDTPYYFKGDPLYLLQSQRGKLLQLVLMHRNIRALDYTESQAVNHKEDFKCPAVKCVNYDISEALFLYMQQKNK